MPKYINAGEFERDCMFDRNCEDMQDVIYKLRDYPSADVVEVVRCKDCKYSVCIPSTVVEDWFCDIKYNEWGEPWRTLPEGFCDDGERKETE